MKHILPWLVAIAVLISSCKKETSQDIKTAKTGPAMLYISVAGVESGFDPVSGASGLQSGLRRGVIVKSQELKEVWPGGSKSPDVEVTTEVYTPSIISNNSAPVSSAQQMSNMNPNRTMGAITPMSPGTKYRFYLLKEDDLNSRVDTVAKVDGIAGQAVPAIPVNAGQRYSFVAFSLNNATALTDKDFLRKQQYNGKAIIVGDESLYIAYGDITPSYGDNPATLTFAHSIVKLDLIFDTKGTGAKIGAISGYGSYAPNSFINGKLWNNNTQQFSLSQPQVTDYTKTFSMNIAAAPADANSFMLDSITITKLTPPSDGELSPIKSQSIDYGIHYFSLQSSLTKPGNYVRVTFRYIGPMIGIKKTGPLPGTVSRVRFAPGDLYLDSRDNMYKFRAYGGLAFEAGLTATGGQFWTYNTLRPYDGRDAATMSSLYPGDPCTKVYPEGTWRLPTASEFSSVDSTLNRWSQVDNTNNGGIFVFSYNALDNRQKSISSPNDKILLRFALYGQVEDGILKTKTSPGLDRSFTSYWGGETNNGVLSATSAVSETITNTGGSTPNSTVTRASLTPSEYQRFAKSIRCVRNE